MNNATNKNYRTYLLRIWRAETPDQGWRASLQDPHTERRIGFASLEQLFAFLMEQVERDAEGEGMKESK